MNLENDPTTRFEESHEPVGEATSPTPATSSGPQFWRSLEERMETPEFREMMYREFPDQADEWTDPVTRRQFVTLMGASIALAGAAGCSPRPASPKKILPYTKQPDGVVPGVASFYATAMPLAGYGMGLLLKSYEGRPVKVEGNPDHPASRGSTDTLAQGSILHLYDPDRSQDVTDKGTPSNTERALADCRKLLEAQKKTEGEKVRFLTETVTSPTLIAQMEEFLKLYPKAKWIQYDAISRDNIREGSRKAFGKYLNAVYDFTKADVVLAIDSDFTCSGPAAVRYSRDFASRRKVRKDSKDGNKPEGMNRLYAVESMPSSTGSIADHRIALKNTDIEAFVRAIAAELKIEGVGAPYALPEYAKKCVAPLVKDLQKSAGKSIVIVGESQPAIVHAIAFAINSTLKNIGETVSFTEPVEKNPSNQLADLKALVEDMKGGKVDTLFILGGNPVFTAPVDLAFADALKKVPNRIHLGLYQDETAFLCSWHLPEKHYLESWGDVRAFDGTVSIIQPLIVMPYSTTSAWEFLAALLSSPEQNGLDIVRKHWKKKFEADKRSGDFEVFWRQCLSDGIVAESALPKITAAITGTFGKEEPKTNIRGIELAFKADPTLYDGRFANNGWLQELPKPVTKICWDNVAYMSPKTAETLGIPTPRASWTAGEHGRAIVKMVELEFKGRKVKAPSWVMPGHADDVITVHVGYGRTRAGKVGNDTGFNAYTLRTSEGIDFDTGVKVTVTNEEFFVACTQMHHSMEERKPVRRGTIKDYQAHPDFASVPPAASEEKDLINELIPGPKENKGFKKPNPNNGHDHTHDDHKHDEHDHKHEGHDHEHEHKHEHDKRLMPLTMIPAHPPSESKTPYRWAMAIDLSSCTGCNTCMIACQSENNIPVVGKTEVTRGREMHWIRVDRYYEDIKDDKKEDSKLKDTIPQDLATYFQPVPCQQCEKAPCEIVCPVAATVHSADGLNDMVYNRCVGTRYCSNNCPYKVRRFNFLTYADYATESLKLLRNPDVSVRSRGVMEKCTYCVSRIREAEIVAQREGRAMVDGEVKTACQAACPSQAIVFGDLNDKNSVVNRWKNEPTNYGLLAELNTMPRTTYLAVVRNPNPEMPKGA